MLLQILTAKQLAVWRIEHNGEILKMRQQQRKSHAIKTANLPLFKGKSVTHANFCVLQNIFSLRLLKCNFLTFCHLINLKFSYTIEQLLLFAFNENKFIFINLWALPTPTTFEKVDQTFNFEQKVWLLFYFVARPKVI